MVKAVSDLNELNRTYQDCKDALVFSKQVTKHQYPSSRPARLTGGTKLRICESQLVAKNDSLHNLQSQYSRQSNELANVTSQFQSCRQDLVDVREELTEEKVKTDTLLSKVHELEQNATSQKQEHSQWFQGLRSIVRGMQRHLQCLQTEESCTQAAELYTCLPSDILDALCLKTSVLGQELFDLNVCSLLGDETWSEFNVPLFIANNPKTTAVLILIVVFSIIGAVTVVLLLVWILTCYRTSLSNKVRSLGRFMLLKYRGSEQKEDGLKMKAFGPKNRSDVEASGGEAKKATSSGNPSAETRKATSSGDPSAETITKAEIHPPPPPMARKDLEKKWKEGDAPLAKEEENV